MTFNGRVLFAGVAAVLSLAASVPAAGQTVFLTDRSAFNQRIGDRQTVTFNGPLPGSLGNPGFIDTGLINVASTSPLFFIDDNRLGSGGIISAQQQGGLSVTFTFDRPVTAFGFDYVAGAPSTLVLGGDAFTLPTAPFPNRRFAGLISDTPFSSARITLTGNGIDLDNLIAGTALSASAVPEPTSWATLLIGFGAVGYSLRSTRRRSSPPRRAARIGHA